MLRLFRQKYRNVCIIRSDNIYNISPIKVNEVFSMHKIVQNSLSQNRNRLTFLALSFLHVHLLIDIPYKDDAWISQWPFKFNIACAIWKQRLSPYQVAKERLSRLGGGKELDKYKHCTKCMQRERGFEFKKQIISFRGGGLFLNRSIIVAWMDTLKLIANCRHTIVK